MTELLLETFVRILWRASGQMHSQLCVGGGKGGGERVREGRVYVCQGRGGGKE